MLMENGQTLRTAACVVAALGGTKGAAEWAGIGESAVSNWLARGFIPPGWHYRLQAHFAPLKIELAPTAFGQIEPKRPKQKREKVDAQSAA